MRGFSIRHAWCIISEPLLYKSRTLWYHCKEWQPTYLRKEEARNTNQVVSNVANLYLRMCTGHSSPFLWVLSVWHYQPYPYLFLHSRPWLSLTTLTNLHVDTLFNEWDYVYFRVNIIASVMDANSLLAPTSTNSVSVYRQPQACSQCYVHTLYHQVSSSAERQRECTVVSSLMRMEWSRFFISVYMTIISPLVREHLQQTGGVNCLGHTSWPQRNRDSGTT